MKSIPEILYLTRARNAEHYRLQEALLKAVPADFATKYKITALRDKYVSLFEKEDSIYLQTRGFADTKELADQDAVRDRLFRLIRLTIQSKELSLVEAEAKAAAKLAFAIKPYSAAASKPDAENTAMVSDCVKKLQSDEYSSSVQALGLTEALTALKTANEEFDAIYSRRADEKRVKTVSEKLTEIRPQVDAAFLEIANAINALYTVNALIDKDQTKETELGGVIDAVNAEILQFSETLSRRGAGKKTKVEPDDRPIIDGDDDKPSGGGNDRPEIE